MKKMFLILLVLMTTATGDFAADFFDDEYEYVTPENNVTEDTVVVDQIIESKVVEDKVVEKPVPENSLPDAVSQINSIQDDEQKVKEWARVSSQENYVIINKKDCEAIVFDKAGDELARFEIGIGRDIGDDFNDTKGILGKPKNTTPAGEYTLISNVFNKSAYGDLTLSLGEKANKSQNTKKVVALHKVPKFRQNDRIKKFYDGNLANNRMSHGCINFLEDDFNKLTKYVHEGLKTYVLPEESDNQLRLEKNSNDELELAQTKY